MLKSDIKIISATKPWRATIATHERYKMTPIAVLAVDIARSLSIGAIPDGETSSGEQRHRLLTTEEIVDKAVAISEMVYAAIESKGWVQELPSLEDMENFAGEEERTGFLTKAEGAV